MQPEKPSWLNPADFLENSKKLWQKLKAPQLRLILNHGPGLASYQVTGMLNVNGIVLQLFTLQAADAAAAHQLASDLQAAFAATEIEEMP